jgi:uncharacterized protein (DUF433 family)
MKAGGRMAKEYIEQRQGGYYLTGVRVSLDSIVYAFLRGESPESIAESFPALNLEQVYGSLAYYLANRDQIDQYLRAEKADFDQLRDESRRAHPLLYSKLEAARQAFQKSS